MVLSVLTNRLSRVYDHVFDRVRGIYIRENGV